MKDLHCSSQKPAFFDKIAKAIKCSWNSLGNIGCDLKEISEDCFEITFFPALREIYGGKDDGDRLFAGFHFNIGRFVRVFDRSPAPKVAYDSLLSDAISHLVFNGYVDGTCLKIIIMESPPQGRIPEERLFAVGPKKGHVEAY